MSYRAISIFPGITTRYPRSCNRILWRTRTATNGLLLTLELHQQQREKTNFVKLRARPSTQPLLRPGHPPPHRRQVPYKRLRTKPVRWPWLRPIGIDLPPSQRRSTWRFYKRYKVNGITLIRTTIYHESCVTITLSCPWPRRGTLPLV